jgi:hypothetical protein
MIRAIDPDLSLPQQTIGCHHSLFLMSESFASVRQNINIPKFFRLLGYYAA